MECKKLKTLSKVSLVISILPLATLIPVFLKLTLPEGVSTAWAGVNIACVVAGLILSMICVRSNESRSLVNIASTAISVFWCLLMAGIVALGLFLTFMQ
ncbi:MAG: hypothetical protein HDR01_10060 [Lachnospiraceae bacterium]|nr:hypothetical protein [Lachnospiraceae bacterium]